jgi:small subunit ribosomal protein S3
MGQKVHPNVFRLGVTTTHSSQWFAQIGKSSQYAQFLKEDILIRSFLEKEAPSIHSIDIQRKNTALLLHLEASRPQEILPNLDALKAKLQERLVTLNLNLNQAAGKTKEVIPYSIFCTLSQANEVSAQSVAYFVKDQLEKRLPFRRAMKKSIRLAKMNGTKGIKIQVSGRLNGAEIARTEWERFGSVSLQSLRAEIDYTECIAHTIYGVIGIKVWVQVDPEAKQKTEKEI